MKVSLVIITACAILSHSSAAANASEAEREICSTPSTFGGRTLSVSSTTTEGQLFFVDVKHHSSGRTSMPQHNFDSMAAEFRRQRIQIGEMSVQIESLQAELATARTRLDEKVAELSQRNIRIAVLESEGAAANASHTAAQAQLTAKISALEAEKADTITSHAVTQATLQAKLNEMAEEAQALKITVTRKDILISGLTTRLTQKEREHEGTTKSLEQRLAEVEASLVTKSLETSNQNGMMDALITQASSKDTELGSLRTQLAAESLSLARAAASLADQEAEVARLKAQIAADTEAHGAALAAAQARVAELTAVEYVPPPLTMSIPQTATPEKKPNQPGPGDGSTPLVTNQSPEPRDITEGKKLTFAQDAPAAPATTTAAAPKGTKAAAPKATEAPATGCSCVVQ